MGITERGMGARKGGAGRAPTDAKAACHQAVRAMLMVRTRRGRTHERLARDGWRTGGGGRWTGGGARCTQ